MRREFYVSIAYLFYAVAKVDKNFQKEEKKKIVELTERYFSTDVASEQSSEIIYETLRFLIKDEFTSDAAFDKFKRYLELNRELFEQKTVHNILVVCHEIANAFSGKNKSELIILARIQSLLNPK